MEMTIIELKKLTASEDMILTNGESYGKEVYLGINSTSDNWHEITLAEYQAKMAELEAEDVKL